MVMNGPGQSSRALRRLDRAVDLRDLRPRMGAIGSSLVFPPQKDSACAHDAPFADCQGLRNGPHSGCPARGRPELSRRLTSPAASGARTADVVAFPRAGTLAGAIDQIPAEPQGTGKKQQSFHNRPPRANRFAEWGFLGSDPHLRFSPSRNSCDQVVTHRALKPPGQSIRRGRRSGWAGPPSRDRAGPRRSAGSRRRPAPARGV
jgi:hypothetical protein